MPLKRRLESGETPPEGLESYYIERDDGTYHLDVDDAEGLKRALNSERAQVKRLNERLRALEVTQDASPGPGQAQATRAPKDETMAARLERLERDMRQRDKAHEQAMQAQKEEKNRLVLEREAARLASRHPINEGAEELVAQQIERTFRVENGGLVARDSNDELIYDGSGEPLTPDAYMDQLRRKKSFLFRDPKGAGVKNGVRTGGSVSPNARHMPYTDQNFQANLKEISEGKIVLDT